MEPYDCTKDVNKHRGLVDEYITDICSMMYSRAMDHDLSKLEEPEKSIIDKHFNVDPELLPAAHSTAAVEQRKQESKALDHHYLVNRHHLEHHVNGAQNMSILDLMEMLCDWRAYAMEAGEYEDPKYKGLIKKLNLEEQRMDIPKDIVAILRNTIETLRW